MRQLQERMETRGPKEWKEVEKRIEGVIQVEIQVESELTGTMERQWQVWQSEQLEGR